jgi:uncharacterized protein YwgA
MTESFRTLTAVIAAHPEGEVVGRIRLQKTICLLQRLGLPTDYLYSLHFYGPYSEDLHSEVTLLKNLEMVQEVEDPVGRDGVQYTIKAVTDLANPELVSEFQDKIDIMAKTSSVILELAATYDMFKQHGNDDATALERLRSKKGSKCAKGNEKRAMQLLVQLGL